MKQQTQFFCFSEGKSQVVLSPSFSTQVHPGDLVLITGHDFFIEALLTYNVVFLTKQKNNSCCCRIDSVEHTGDTCCMQALSQPWEQPCISPELTIHRVCGLRTPADMAALQ